LQHQIFPLITLTQSNREIAPLVGSNNWPKLAALDPWVLGVLAQLRDLILAFEAQLAELQTWVPAFTRQLQLDFILQVRTTSKSLTAVSGP
jgi:hypothetical protein